MGIGSSIKKTVKKAANQVTGSVKTIYKKPFSKESLESVTGIAATPFVGNSSLVLTGDAGRRVDKQETQEKNAARTAALVEENKKKYGWGSMAEVISAQKKKEEELASRRERRVRGISSLIGDSSSLG